VKQYEANALLDPILMAIQVVAAQANHFHSPPLKIGLPPRNFSELGGAYGSKVCRVGEEYDPGVFRPFMEGIEGSLGGLGGKIRGGGSEAEGRHFFFGWRTCDWGERTLACVNDSLMASSGMYWSVANL